MRDAPRTLEKGLSPRVRGNRRPAPPENPCPGSIPACAGEPDISAIFVKGSWVYPRVCGGTCSLPMPSGVCRGLSPRVRGNLNHVRISKSQHGSIPACAGEPLVPSPSGPRTQVYPRVCGGTVFTFRFLFPMMGLSPRVRGNRIQTDRVNATGGSIPACAGEPGGSRTR